MLLSSIQLRHKSDIWGCTPSSVSPSEPLVWQLQGMSSRALGLRGNLFSYLSYTKIGLEMLLFL